MADNKVLGEDQHSKIAILFKTAEDEETHIVVSVKWVLQYGYPRHPETDDPMIYVGTFIIQ